MSDGCPQRCSAGAGLDREQLASCCASCLGGVQQPSPLLQQSWVCGLAMFRELSGHVVDPHVADCAIPCS
jgi:hypothetical protein